MGSVSLVCAKAVEAMSADLIQITRTEYEALKSERDEIQAALEELRWRWVELVVTADPSVMENRDAQSLEATASQSPVSEAAD